MIGTVIRKVTWANFSEVLIEDTMTCLQGQWINVEAGYYELDRARPLGNLTSLCIEAWFYSREPTSEAEHDLIEPPLRNPERVLLMQFDYQSLDAERGETKGWCADDPPALRKIYAEELERIERRWPAEPPAASGAEGAPTAPTVGNGNGLTYIEQKILDAYNEIVANGETAADELIAAKLPTSGKGRPYTRETVNRKRQAMRKRGVTV